MTILDKYKTSGNLVLHIPFRKGTLLDDSGNGNNATVTGLASWKNANKSRGISLGSDTSYITVADNGAAAELQMTSGFLYWFGSPLSIVNGTMRFLAKSDAGGNNYDLFSSETSIQFFAGGVTSSFTTTMYGKRFFAVRFAPGQKPAFFVDGSFVGDGSSAVTATVNDADLIINNYYAGTIGRRNPNPCLDVGIINTNTITDQEIAQLYNELMAEGGYGDPKVSNFHVSFPKDETGKCILHWDMSTLTGDGKMLDRIGNGRHGTIARVNLKYTNPFDASKFNGSIASNVKLANGLALIANNQNFAYSLWLNPDTLANNPIILGNGTSGNSFYLQVTPSGLATIVGGGTRTYSLTTPLTHWTHFYFEKTGAGNNGNLYVNNVLLTPSGGNLGDTSNFTQDLMLGTWYPAGYELTGSMADFRLYSSNLTAAERTKLYNDGAKLLKLSIPIAQDTCVTLADVTAGKIDNSPWNVFSGTWNITQDTTTPFKKWVNCAGAGIAYAQQKFSYGTFVFDFYPTGSNTSAFMPIANKNYSRATSGQYGYVVYTTGSKYLAFAKTVNGAVGNLFYTNNSYLAAGTKYRLCYTRTIAGVHTLYIKGGTFTNWTLVDTTGGLGTNPITNTEVTQASFYATLENAGTGDKLGSFYHCEGIINPIINPELIPN